MRSFLSALYLALCVILAGSMLASQNSRSAASAPLTNKDILLMLKAGLSPEIVIAKIKSSDCSFDTDPDTLAGLKKSKIPDGIILAMVQAHKADPTTTSKTDEGETVYVNCTSSEVKRPIHSTNFFGSSTLAEAGCADALTALGKERGYVKVRTRQGVLGYIMEDYVSKTQPEVLKEETSPSQPALPSRLANAPASSRLPAGILRAVAWRAVPWATTFNYQQPGTANSSCTGSGTWIGDIWRGNASCTTQYTPAQSVPINWEHFTIYNLVETSDSLLVVACTRNFAWSKCSYLIPGSTFPFEYKGGRVSVRGHRGGKEKEQSLDLDIVSTQPKT
jgi:hypothetical protein